jgi:hypothetical protein
MGNWEANGLGLKFELTNFNPDEEKGPLPGDLWMGGPALLPDRPWLAGWPLGALDHPALGVSMTSRLAAAAVACGATP